MNKQERTLEGAYGIIDELNGEIHDLRYQLDRAQREIDRLKMAAGEVELPVYDEECSGMLVDDGEWTHKTSQEVVAEVRLSGNMTMILHPGSIILDNHKPVMV